MRFKSNKIIPGEIEVLNIYKCLDGSIFLVPAVSRGHSNTEEIYSECSQGASVCKQETRVYSIPRYQMDREETRSYVPKAKPASSIS